MIPMYNVQSLNDSERKVNPRFYIFRSFWNLVFPEMLHWPGHQKKTSVVEQNLQLIHIFAKFMPDPKRPGFSKTNRSDDRINTVFPLMVPMPGNTVLTGTI